VFPDRFDKTTLEGLKKILPSVPAPILTGEEEECTMDDVDLTQFGQNDSNHDNMDSDDESGGRGGKQVQCQNM